MNLSVKNLNKTFPISGNPFFGAKKVVRAVSHISVSVEERKSLGIVGESGSGKTTFAKMLAGFLKADSGTARFNGVDLLRLNSPVRSHLVQMIFQNPFESLNPKLLLRTQLFEVLKNLRQNQKKSKADALMGDVGLSLDFLNRYPHQLSGGQRQRFAIARSLAALPKLLIADEPVSSLDLSVQAQIINLLNELRQKKGFTLIVISHDLAVIANICDHVMVMKEGDLVEYGSVDTVLTQPQQPYTKKLIHSAPVL